MLNMLFRGTDWRVRGVINLCCSEGFLHLEGMYIFDYSYFYIVAKATPSSMWSHHGNDGACDYRACCSALEDRCGVVDPAHRDDSVADDVLGDMCHFV